MNVFFSHIKIYKIVFNLVSSIFALIVSGLLLLVLWLPSWGVAISEAMIHQYEISFIEKSEKALLRLEEGDMSVALKSLQDDFAMIQKGDRAYVQKRIVLMALCSYLYQKAHYQLLIHWSRIWVHLDERDINALAYYYQSLWLVGKKSEDLVSVRRLAIRFPGNQLAQQFVQQNSLM